MAGGSRNSYGENHNCIYSSKEIFEKSPTVKKLSKEHVPTRFEVRISKVRRKNKHQEI